MKKVDLKKLWNSYISMVRRFLPEEQKEPAVGLDIGAHSVKAVQLDKTGDQYTLTAWGVEPIANGDIKASVERLFSRLNITTKSPYTSVFGRGTLIRCIDFPRMSYDDLKQSFALEADKYFPFPQDTIYTDCYILDPKGKEARMGVLVAAVKKEIVDERVQLMGQLSFQPALVGIDSVAVANTFHVLNDSAADQPEHVTAFLDIGEAVSHLMILRDKKPRFNRDIYIGGMEFTKHISNVMGVTLAEAGELKTNPGPRAAEVMAHCELVIHNLISEIHLSMDYFITEKNVQVSKLYLTGGGCKFVGLSEAIAKQLDMPVEIWNPFNKITMGDGVDAAAVNENAQRLLVSTGLALYHYDTD